MLQAIIAFRLPALTTHRRISHAFATIGFSSFRVCVLLIAFNSCLVFTGVQPIRAQSFGSQDRDRGITMLKIIKEDISKHYYDPPFTNRPRRSLQIGREQNQAD